LGHLVGEQRLTQLAHDAPLTPLFGSQHHVTNQLLGDSRGAGNRVVGLDVLDHGPANTSDIHAGVHVEIGVLGRQRGIDQMLRNLRQRDHRPATPLCVVELPQKGALSVIDLGRLESLAAVDLIDRGQIAIQSGVGTRPDLDRAQNGEDEEGEETDADQTAGDKQALRAALLEPSPPASAGSRPAVVPINWSAIAATVAAIAVTIRAAVVVAIAARAAAEARAATGRHLEALSRPRR
jgi:hypothetical protein